MLTPLGQESPASEASSSARSPSQGACLRLSRDWGCALGSLNEGGFSQASPPYRAPVLFVIAGISGGTGKCKPPALHSLSISSLISTIMGSVSSFIQEVTLSYSCWGSDCPRFVQWGLLQIGICVLLFFEFFLWVPKVLQAHLYFPCPRPRTSHSLWFLLVESGVWEPRAVLGTLIPLECLALSPSVVRATGRVCACACEHACACLHTPQGSCWFSVFVILSPVMRSMAVIVLVD